MTTPLPSLIDIYTGKTEESWIAKLLNAFQPLPHGGVIFKIIPREKPKVITDHAVAAGGTCLPCMTFERIFFTRTHYFHGGRRTGRTYLHGEQSVEKIIPRSAYTTTIKRIKE